MHVQDLEGTHDINDEAVLLGRLSSVRRGHFGAFVLSHGGPYPSLWVHFNDDRAYLHYFPKDRHPGFQPTAVSKTTQDSQTVRFLQIDGSEADSFDMPSSIVVDRKVALNAVSEFFRSPDLPPSIDWFEL